MIKLVSFLLLLTLSGLRAQPAEMSADIELLLWNEFYKLQWDDFQGEPDPGSLGDAGTAVRIKAAPFLVKKEIKYDIEAFFNRKKSWVRDKSRSLLAHEQLHFDIAELYARKIRKKVRELQDRGVDNIKTYNAAIHELLLESNNVDAQYDLETLHGALSKKQAAWAQKIKEQLAQLKRYRKTKRVIGKPD
jgi:hypothetical protein